MVVALVAAFYAFRISRARIITTEREKREIALAEKGKLLKASIDSSENERTKIAEELHDQVNAQLTVVRMAIARSEKNEALESAMGTLDDAIQDLRSISRDLMPPVLERFGLLDALDDLFGRIEQQAGLHIDFDAPEEWIEKNIQRDLALYRIVQEFCQNTMKYAQASQISVKIAVSMSWIFLELKDDGVGYDSSTMEMGLGTRNIFSRAEYLNAEVDLRSKPGEGVYLSLRTPLESKRI